MYHSNLLCLNPHPTSFTVKPLVMNSMNVQNSTQLNLLLASVLREDFSQDPLKKSLNSVDPISADSYQSVNVG